MLPILKRFAQSYQDFPQMRDSNAHNSLQLSASALTRWYELDPIGARPAFITEISRPRPRFDARVLGILPDKTLPELDFTLAENFAALDDLDGSANLASLIARFATVAVLPQIVEKVDAKIGKWACATQNPTLAYLLRVDPALARPRIEKAIAARGEGFSACRHQLLQIVSDIHYDPVLEEIAIESLDDPDPQVAATAATMLGKFGSPAAESALWQRYTSWSATWAGRESELVQMLAGPVNETAFQHTLGQNLARALATGKSWLSDRTKLQRLSQTTKLRTIQQQVDTYLKSWDNETFAIVIYNAAPDSFHAQVAQYELHSLNALKEKLAQFPAETKFGLSTAPWKSTAGDQAMTDLLAFLKARGANKK